VAGVALVSLFSLIQRHETADWDTDHLVHQGLDGTYRFSWKGAGDIAHPLGYVPIRLFLRAFGDSADTAWHLLLGVVLVLIVACLLAIAVWRRAGSLRFLAAAALLGVSLVFRDLASRAEENLIGDLLFVATAGLILVYVSRESSRSRWLIPLGVAALLTALNHFQFFLVLAGSVLLASAVTRRGPMHLSVERVVGLVTTVVAIPGLAVLLLNRLDVARSFAYQDYFQSVFNPRTFHGLPDWTYGYFRYASKWVLGLDASAGAPPGGAARALLGLAAIAIALVVVVWSRDVVVAGLGVAALALPFLYEPQSPERWDAFVLVVALAIVSRAPTAARTPPTPRETGRPAPA
jgi:hypothetical protein